MTEYFYQFFVFIIGLCLGSFLNVVALRAFSNESIVFPPSKCPKCNKRLKWYHNIPVISYIFLRGKCGFCKEKISIQYPLVELSTAVLFLSVFNVWGFSLKTLFLWALMFFFMLIVVTDIKEQVVFDFHTYPIIVLGFIYNLLYLGHITIWESILGIVAGFLIFEIISRSGYLFANQRMFGEGDTIIAMGLGAFFGWKILIIISILAVLIQAVVAFPILIFKGIKNKQYEMLFAFLIMCLCIFITKLPLEVFVMLPLVLVLLVLCVYLLLKNLKQQKQYTLMPFGPALVFGAIIMIFWSDKVVNFINMII